MVRTAAFQAANRGSIPRSAAFMKIYLLYILLGLLPSFVWLLFYLRKDSHPESNFSVLKIFVWGMLIAPLAVILQFGLLWLTAPSFKAQSLFATLNQINQGWRGLISLVIFAPLVEEYLKYAIVKAKIAKNSHFDEPLDAMLYLIIGALGFAAVENLIIVLRIPPLPLQQAIETTILRFAGATLLHGLASGIVGYYLAKSFLETQKRFPLIIHGLALAIFFHGVYNYLINLLEKTYAPLVILALIILLASLALFVSAGFQKLKKQLSVCKIIK